jgi:hypothetical protein
MARSVPAPPEGLADAGRALWAGLWERFDFRPDEAVTLTACCRLADTADRLAAVVAREGDVVPGPDRGVHPALAEGRQTALALGRLLATLRIPDEGQVPQRRAGSRGFYGVA